MTETDSPDNLKTQDAPAAQDPAPEHAQTHAPDLRSHARHNVRWHADVLLDGHIACEGYAREVSADGMTLFLDINPEKTKSIELRIHVPPMDDKHGQHIVEVSGRAIYSTHDAEEQMFRAGIHFTHFRLDSDPAFLAARLES